MQQHPLVHSPVWWFATAATLIALGLTWRTATAGLVLLVVLTYAGFCITLVSTTRRIQ